jgi:rhodanese-related sulfurtransferase
MPRRCSIDDLRVALGGPCQAIDVREAGEYETERIDGTRLAPLSVFERHLEALDRARPVYVVCRSGNRAHKAADRLLTLGWHDVHVVEGGLLAWTAAGHPVRRGTRRVWSLERQVRFAAGLLVLASVVGALAASPWVAVFAGLVGAGLMFSAATDTCAMGIALARMPWNRAAMVEDSCRRQEA